jgi:preprotein translocase subunit SecG
MLLGLLLVAQITVSVLLVCVVLLQRSEGGGFVGGGSPSGMMSVRGAGDLMTRITWTLGALFFAISLLLTIIAGREKGASSVVDRLKVDSIDPSALNQPPAGTAQPGSPSSAPTPLQAPTPQVNNPFLGGEAPAAPAPTAPPQK